MNEVMILRRGGGVRLFAAIGVEYQPGAACRCVGKNTKKELAAKDVSGLWIFPVPAVDDWTVIVSLNGRSREKTVSITKKNQCEKISLPFTLELLSRENGLVEGYSLALPSISPAINVTDYSKLRIAAKRVHASYAAASVIVGLSASSGGAVGSKQWAINTDTESTVEIDLSDVSGEWFFSVDGGTELEMSGTTLLAGSYGASGYGARAELYDITFS